MGSDVYQSFQLRASPFSIASLPSSVGQIFSIPRASAGESHWVANGNLGDKSSEPFDWVVLLWKRPSLAPVYLPLVAEVPGMREMGKGDVLKT